MARKRTRDFEREIPKIISVAESKNAPEQLSLDELRPGQVHGWDTVRATEYGYFGTCLCGWRSREMITRADAHHEIRRHLGRTPQGSVLLRTLRKLGRGGTGA